MKQRKTFIVLVATILLLSFSSVTNAGVTDLPSGDFVIEPGVVKEVSNRTINGDLYIYPGAIYQSYGSITVTGNVYVFGTFQNYGSIVISGTCNCLNYYNGAFTASAGDYDYGKFYNYGRMSVHILNVKDDYLSVKIPDIDSDQSDPSPTVAPTPTVVPTPVPTVTPIPTATPTPTDTPSGHDHIYKKVTTKATVSQNGSVVKKCRICGMITSNETIYRPADISLSETEYVYDGTAKKPSVTVKDSNGNVIASRYYNVSYETDCKSVGTHTIKITFSIKYTGTVTKTFNITKGLQEINVSNITIPYVTRTFQANATIRKGDGKLSYKSRNTSIFTVSENGVITPKGVGVAKLTVYASETNTFKKTGKTIYVKVIPNGTGITSLLNDKSRSATIQWKRNKRVNGYQIRYSIYSDFKRSKLITVKKNSITAASIPKLTRGRTYYVQIRTYKTISGKNYYSGWSNVKKVNVTK